MGRAVAEEEREAALCGVDGGACVEVDMERGASEVPRRALNTISSGLGTSKAKPCDEVAEGGWGASCRLCVLRRGFSKMDRCSSVTRLCFCFSGVDLTPPITSSSTSNEAKADGRARAREDFVANMGRSREANEGSASGSGSLCFCAFLLFIASLDGLGANIPIPWTREGSERLG